MANFEAAHSFVIKEEGGYQELISDTGNYVDGIMIGTNYGISAPTLKSYLGRTPTKDEMKNLSFDDAVLIYIQNYWSKINGDEIKNDSVGLLIYDGAVNQGVGAMRTVVSNAMKNLGSPISKELVFTNQGIKRLNKLNQEKLFDEIYKGRKERYENGQPQFIAGHLRRLSGIKFSGNKFPTWAIISISVGVVSLLALSAYSIYKKTNE